MDALNWNPSAMTRKPRATNEAPTSPSTQLVPVKADSQRKIEKKPVPGGDDLLKAIGQKVAEARKAHSWNQPELSRQSGVPLSTVFTAENGVHNLSILTLFRLAQALKIDMRALLPGPDLVDEASDPDVVMLKSIEKTLEVTLKDMGQTTLVLQQVRQLLFRKTKPAHLKGASDG